MRIMGLDYGSKTVGVAISDELLVTAQPVETIIRKDENKLRKTFARIETLIEEYNIEKVVVGLPIHMDDSVGERAKLSIAFADNIKRRTGLEVVMEDERLSTFEADQILVSGNIKASERKKYIDKIAASFILQDYLDKFNEKK
ncbi:MAG: Holliday junction resolvase RuvX [Lachnospiraceae bacterium]|nr:Holliday junction resolvase RuvX [Lachnospiraceae bacterium]